MSERDKAIEEAGNWYREQDYSPAFPLAKILADFYIHYHAKQNAEAEKKLAKLEAWTQKLNRVHWRDGAIENRGEYGFALFDCSGAIIEHYPTLLAAIYAYLEQAEGGEE